MATAPARFARVAVGGPGRIGRQIQGEGVEER